MAKYYFNMPDEISNNIFGEQTFEICANMVPDSANHLKLIDIVYGESPERGRASCSVKRYTPIIFHTHPKSSYSVPSMEDIIKVFRHSVIKTSVIATYWGIFQIVKFANLEISEPLQLKIKEIIDRIIKLTVNPEYLRIRKLYNTNNIPKNIAWDELSTQTKTDVKEYFDMINLILNKKGAIYFREPYIYVA